MNLIFSAISNLSVRKRKYVNTYQYKVNYASPSHMWSKWTNNGRGVHTRISTCWL